MVGLTLCGGSLLLLDDSDHVAVLGGIRTAGDVQPTGGAGLL